MSKRNRRNHNRRKKSSGGSRLVTVLIVLAMIAGVGIMLYPSFSNWYNSLHQSRAIADYNRTVSSNDSAENEKMWEEALAYNEDLAKTGVNFGLSAYNNEQTSGETGDAEDAELAAERKRYEETLDVSGTGIMGYIDIDKVNIHLPIYHDSSEGVLQVAVGHIAGTSLPVGGPSSHSVLTGHTGLPSAKLFTDIDQLDVGDTFQIIVLDHTLTYQVSDIQTVLPNEVDSLAIEDGQDLCTLVTCTPYGINTHRLLVTGTRIATPVSDDVTTIALPSASWMQQSREVTLQMLLPYLVIAAAAAVTIIVILLTHRRHRGVRHSGYDRTGEQYDDDETDGWDHRETVPEDHYREEDTGDEEYDDESDEDDEDLSDWDDWDS